MQIYFINASFIWLHLNRIPLHRNPRWKAWGVIVVVRCCSIYLQCKYLQSNDQLIVRDNLFEILRDLVKYSTITLTDFSVNPSTSNFNFVNVFQNPGCTRELKGAYCIAMDCASAMFLCTICSTITLSNWKYDKFCYQSQVVVITIKITCW